MRFPTGGARGVPLLLVLLSACAAPQGTRSDADFRQSLAGVDWELVELDGQAAPEGAGGRRATLTFEDAEARAGGFAGCNSYGGSYVVDGAALRFGALAATRMACDRGMDLETSFLRALERTSAWALTGNELVLRDSGGVVARLRRPGT